jgi:hypothetical protein
LEREKSISSHLSVGDHSCLCLYLSHAYLVSSLSPSSLAVAQAPIAVARAFVPRERAVAEELAAAPVAVSAAPAAE